MTHGERLGVGLGGAGLLLALVLLPSSVFYGDGWGLVESLARRELVLPHPGYVTAGALVGIPTGSRPETALRLVSALGGALLVAGTFAGLRGLRFARGPAAFGALLVALAPATLFFSRHIEVHALHAGCAAVAFAAIANASRGRPFALASLLVTHASGVLSAPFLLWIGASTSRERKAPWRPLLLGALLALLFAAGVSAFQAAYAPGALVHPGDWSPVHAALRLFRWLGGSGSEGGTGYPVHALLLPAGLLSAAGLVGLVCLFLRARSLGVPLLAWTLVYLAFWAWNGFAERGGYLMPIYPALAAGAAELARSFLARAGRVGLAWRWVPAGALSLVVVGQGAFGVARGFLPSQGPDPFRWVEALREETRDEGSFATLDPAHGSLARRYAGLEVVHLSTIVAFRPADRRPALDAVAAEALRLSRAGRRVYFDGDMPGEYVGHPEFEGLLDRLREQGELREVARPPLHLWRVFPR
ncbi:MAG: hypothetical protein L0323_08580 [Planctomycetes bacterium]|nr:hypothetical protein [Planctomycetota bacterium]